MVEGKLFCVHGGLSPFLPTIEQIRLINRKQEIPREGGFCDLLWSDPDDNVNDWIVSPRGAGFLFGQIHVDEFNHINGLDLICRAHQLVMEGFKYLFENQNLCTVWSAPNYCYRCGNRASILKIDSDLSRTVNYFDFSEKNPQNVAEKAIVPYFL